MSESQDPQAVLDYEWDWSSWLEGETIVSYTVTVNDPTLTISNTSNTATTVKAFLGPGANGRTYLVTAHVVASDGREDDKTLTLVLRQDYANQGPMSACEWPVDYSECGPCDALASMPVSGQEKFEQMATEFLWRWTGKRFGYCDVVARPCRQDCYEGLSTYGGGQGSPWTPTIINGRWFNLGCGACGDKCGCSWVSSLRFDRPVSEIAEITIDGVVLDPSAYRVDNQTLLVRQDGGIWPYCQDMSRPLGEEDTWSIRYRVGTGVPIGGQIAAGLLACELAKAACRDSSCQLPQRWQTITRQGVTVAATIDNFEGIDGGKTGIWLIDSWVASVTQSPMGVGVLSPDSRSQLRRQTWPSV